MEKNKKNRQTDKNMQMIERDRQILQKPGKIYDCRQKPVPTIRPNPPGSSANKYHNITEEY